MRRLTCALALGVLWFSACSKARVGGDPREVTILADESVWAATKSTLVEGLERKVLLLDEETVFWCHHLGADAMETVRRRPLMVFLAAAEERGQVADLVEAFTGRDVESLAASSPFTRLVDPWARGQVVYVLAGRRPAQVDSLAARVVGRLYEDFLARYRATVRERLYVRGENRRLARDLAARYGWSISVPVPWDVEEKPQERWVHFVKTDPDRHVSIYWEDWAESTFSAEYCIRKRKDLAWRYYDEDEVDGSRTSYSWSSFQGRPSLEIAGAWINQKYVAGGPFRTICFLVPSQQRLYLIDLVTFAPDRPKFYVMTQLGLIAETFAVAEHDGVRSRPSKADS